MKAKQYIESSLQKIFAKQKWTWQEKIVVEPSREKKTQSFGDYSTNAAMLLAKELNLAPRVIAEEIISLLKKDSTFKKIEIAGPGFINFFFEENFWLQVLEDIKTKKDTYGHVSFGKGKKVLVEYVSANPTGPLHIGHGRGAALGDALTRILRACGFSVSTEYYINDAGNQMQILANSIWVRLQELLGEKPQIPEDFYKGSYITNIAAEILEKYPDVKQMDKAEALIVCSEYGIKSILTGIQEDLKDFQIEHQNWFSEKKLIEAGHIVNTFENLEKLGVSYEAENALWLATTRFEDDKDRVLRKSSGELTYFASDIAYHDNKLKRGFDILIDIWGADHHGYVARMQAACELLGKKDALKCVLVQLVNLLQNGEQIAMSTRAGKFETLKAVVDEVGTDATRFIFLSRKSDSPLDFDLALVKEKTMDNPVYYVQYAHARICSLLLKAETEKGLQPASIDKKLLPLLNTSDDLEIMKLLDLFPTVVSSAAKDLSPHYITYYLQDLASSLHKYYTLHHVLTAEESITKARLCLLEKVAQVIKNGLALLGVSAPEKM